MKPALPHGGRLPAGAGAPLGSFGCRPGPARFQFRLAWIFMWLLSGLALCPGAEPFAVRGYYMTFMRMPTFGLAQWQSMIDCLEEDGANTLLLWTAGGFRSRKFPVTWQYNREHENVRQDFVRDLIEYAHRKRIKVLLGFTPFAYDGVNQYPLEHPELKATRKDGRPVELWGMHSWGYNLCPAQTEAQGFMLDYVREMFFDFYPNADGLMVETSDYAICYCPDCREKFFDREFAFVHRISEEVWQKNPAALVAVYPHYFSGRAVPGFDVAGARQPFDPRWTLFFTPHSTAIDTNLLARARSSIFWNDGLTLGTPQKIRDGARSARRYGINGYVPSLEPFSCIDGPAGSGKPRQKPFHFEWLSDGQMPLRELLIEVNRLAYRWYSQDPDLSETDFRKNLSAHFFSTDQSSSRPPAQAIDDLLYLRNLWSLDADWFKPSPLVGPGSWTERAQTEGWAPERRASYARRIEQLRDLAGRYRHDSATSFERELHRIAALILSHQGEIETRGR